MKKTLQSVEKEIHEELKRYIRSTYNISDESVNRQRNRLLDEIGVIKQNAYVESTQKYVLGEKFESIDGLPASFKTIVNALSDDPKLIFDPPYSHQLESVRQTLVEQGSSLVMTGTGSGKTESFLWPILGKIAAEADHSKETYELSAMRALMLYPMNALVNDQLGRIRSLFADPRLKDIFLEKDLRIPTFSRYTSRTFYPGKQSKKRDKRDFKEYKRFFNDNKIAREDANHPDHKEELRIYEQLKDLGKWPAKDDLSAWFDDEYKTQPNDSELLTRHESQDKCPDLLVTNTSMLRYMMIRPIERSIFEQTRKWLEESEEKLLIVLDEAHLYSGTQATEIALLIRRLIDRLEVSRHRIQIIMTSASFSDEKKALNYLSQLTSVEMDSIISIKGQQEKKDNESRLNMPQMEELEKIDPKEFLSVDKNKKKNSVTDFLRFLGFDKDFDANEIDAVLYDVLKEFEPLNKLINSTMGNAKTFSEIGKELCPEEFNESINTEQVVSNLFMLATQARPKENSPSLLPTRQHIFLRGLPGLWACMNPNCDQLEAEDIGGPIGKLYSQPIDRCKCGSKVLEYFTCKLCGADFAKAYAEDLDSLDHDDTFLWSESGSAYLSSESISISETLKEVDLYLGRSPKQNSGVWESPVYPVNYDFLVSRVNSEIENSETLRKVFITRTQYTGDNQEIQDRFNPNHIRKFYTCPSCNEKAGIAKERRSPIENHQTKGVEPIKAITSKVISTQPPNIQEDKYNPLGGRKALFFSDSREKAADLPKKFDGICLRDAIRPLVALGYQELPNVTLDYIFGALLLGSARSGIRLRHFNTPGGYVDTEEDFFSKYFGRDRDEFEVSEFYRLSSSKVPFNEIIEPLISSVFHKRFGFYPLAIASVKERKNERDFERIFESLNSFPATEEQKLFLIRLWLNFWAFNRTSRHKPKFAFAETDPFSSEFFIEGINNLFFRDYMSFVGMYFHDKQQFKEAFRPVFEYFISKDGQNFYLKPEKLIFNFEEEWGICKDCTRINIFNESYKTCVNCLGETERIDPYNHSLFTTRTGYFRKPIIDALTLDGEKNVVSFISKEHTAQLNATSTDKNVFSPAEMNELTFQGVQMKGKKTDQYIPTTDILSSTTTMEVGIDIGSLDAVGLRGMPPSRSNYQQRSGRAGRRGNSMSTVFAWGDVDSHDNQYFNHPEEMISGPVADPIISLKNKDIASRHVNAYILESFLDSISDEELKLRDPNVFRVLGSVKDFRENDSNNPITIKKLEKWVSENETKLKDKIKRWLPEDLEIHFDELLDLERFLAEVRDNTDHFAVLTMPADNFGEMIEENDQGLENDSSERVSDELITKKLLNDELLEQLMLRGVLPKSGFPTDIVNLNIFDTTDDDNGRKIKLEHTPSYPLSTAITAYAPGSTRTIDGYVYTSHGIYTFNDEERKQMYNKRATYFKCENCGQIDIDYSVQEKDLQRSCQTCNSLTLESRLLIKPVGFAHSRAIPPESGFDKEAGSGRSQVMTRMKTPDEMHLLEGYENISYKRTRDYISFTNNGPKNLGFDYCKDCGSLAASADHNSELSLQSHYPPHPRVINQIGNAKCNNQDIERNLYLGTEIFTDILFIKIDLQPLPIILRPGETPTKVVLQTVSEAVARAASEILQIDPSEISGLCRHANESGSIKGKNLEFILFDTIDNGAGYSNSINLNLSVLFNRALNILRKCENEVNPDGCDSSCYGCLNEFANKYRNSNFDRHLAIAFLESLITNQMSEYSASRIEESYDLIFNDISRLSGDFSVSRNQKKNFPSTGEIEIPLVVSRDGKEIYVGLTNPLTSKEFFDKNLKKIDEITLTDIVKIEELQVRKALPQAANEILRQFENE